MKPFVGLPTVIGSGCAYAADIDGTACAAPGVTHFLVSSVSWGQVSLVSCSAHEAIAAAAADLLARHPYRAECDSSDCWSPE